MSTEAAAVVKAPEKKEALFFEKEQKADLQSVGY